MSRALIIVDVQNDYFPGGKMELSGMDAAAENCASLLEAFRTGGMPVYHIQHLSVQPGATFFIPESEGCEINSAVTPLAEEPVIRKHFPSAFRDTGLHQALSESGIDELVICGAMTHMCIDTTTRAAFDLGYRCDLLEDACATRDLEYSGRTVAAGDVQAAYMAALGAVFAAVDSTGSFLSEG